MTCAVDCLPEDDEPERDVPREVIPDWDSATSFVISGPLPGWPGRGRTFPREEASRWVNRTYRVLEPIPANLTPGRWAFRVLRPTAPGGRYTPPGERTRAE